MKVAIIRRRIHSYGGVEGYSLRLIRGLKEKGVEVGVLAEGYEPEQGVRFYPIKRNSFSFSPGPLLFNQRCQEIIEREGFDLVHSLERTWPQDIYRAGEGCHAEFMKTLSLKDRLKPKHLLTLYMEKKTFLSSPYIMANSERVKKEIIRHYGIPEDHLVVIYTGVDIYRFNPEKISILRPEARKRMGLKEEELVILFIGSGFKRKGLKLLLRALAKIDSTPFKLLVAGKGRISYYSSLANSLGLGEKVKFLGLVKEVDALYAAADFLVLPSLYEPFSNTCLEAMAGGVPALTTRGNGVSEILKNGLEDLIIEDPFDREEMVRKIRALISKERRQAFSSRVYQLARKFSMSWHLDEVVKLYELALKKKGKS